MNIKGTKVKDEKLAIYVSTGDHQFVNAAYRL